MNQHGIDGYSYIVYYKKLCTRASKNSNTLVLSFLGRTTIELLPTALICTTFTPQIKGNNRAIYLISHIPSSPGHYNDFARESCSFELFDLLSDIQTKVELHSLYRRVNSISIVGFSFKV